MNKLNEITDTTTLIPVSDFPYATWKFSHLNPVQSALFPFVHQDCNGLVAASTSAGKTVTSEMFGSFALRKQNKKFIFLCPLRALANEKYNDWTDPSHHFSDLKISILTGDYKGDLEKTVFDDSDIIIMTSEMLNHKLRVSSKNKGWIKEVGVLVVDESHLLTVQGRGDHLESALMNFSKISPETRIILLSATMPNVNEIAQWMADSLNGKQTFIMRSNYRPCKLNIHSCTFDDQSAVRPAVYELIDNICDRVQKFVSDKFLVFAHTKRMGEMIVNSLASRNIEAHFHNANLNKTERENLENRFKNDKKLRVLVATSTLAYGLNLPARRVIIAGVHRGNEIVPSYDILQMVGRAGRPAFDPEGDAYVYYPESRRIDLQPITLNAQRIESRMLDLSPSNDYATMAFHLLYEIHCGNVKKIDDANVWFNRTLAFYQKRQIKPNLLKNTLDKLVKLSILSYNKDFEEYELTGLGKVSVIYYANPFDVASWSINFHNLFKKTNHNDVDICVALANTSGNFIGSISKEDAASFKDFLIPARKMYDKTPDNVLKVACLYYRMLHGRHEPKHAAIIKTLQQDAPRLMAILQAIDTFSKKWNKSNFFTVLGKRLQHGVPVRLLSLIEIKGIGKVKAEKLFEQGYKTVSDIRSNLEQAAKIAGVKSDTLQNNLPKS
jgi:replicative superfamily II helicase